MSECSKSSVLDLNEYCMIGWRTVWTMMFPMPIIAGGLGLTDWQPWWRQLWQRWRINGGLVWQAGTIWWWFDRGSHVINGVVPMDDGNPTHAPGIVVPSKWSTLLGMFHMCGEGCYYRWRCSSGWFWTAKQAKLRLEQKRNSTKWSNNGIVT